MPLQKIITQLQRPLEKKRKLFSLVLILLLVIGGLGAAYYFHIQAENERIVIYKTQQLDNYYQKFKRRFDNDQLRKNATLSEEKQKLKLYSHVLIASPFIPLKSELTFKSSFHQEQDCNFMESPSQKCINNFAKEILTYDKDFSEFAIVIADKHHKDNSLFGSTIHGLDNQKLVGFLNQDSLWFTQKEWLTLNHQRFLAIAKKYHYSSSEGLAIDLTLIGLINEKAFKNEVGQLDPALVALLITILLILVIGLPFFKMVFISEDERLFSYDVIFAGLSTILGAPIIFILLLSTQQYIEQYWSSQDQLKQIASEIKKAFETENESITKAISTFDFETYQNQWKSKNRDGVFFEAESKDTKGFDTTNLSYFKYVSQIESNGKVSYHINFIAPPPEGKAPKNLKDRIYLSDLRNHRNVWKVGFQSADTLSYVMRPVVSIEKNSEEAVYAKWLTKNDKSAMAIFSTQLKSLHFTKLPIGFQFAIVDQEGEVWFHSQAGKSTLENLFGLSQDDEALEAAIKGRVKAQGKFVYHGDDQLYACQPIKATNLSVVVFSQVELIGLQLSEVLSLTSISFLILSLFMAVVVLISVFVKNPKWGLYKFYQFPFQFLLPKKNLSGVYRYLTAVFIGLFIVLAFFRVEHNSPSFIFLVGVLVVYWSYVLCFSVLRIPLRKARIDLTDYSLIAISVLLNGVLLVVVKNSFCLISLLLLEVAFLLFIVFSYTKWFRLLFYKEEEIDSQNVTNEEQKNITYKYSYVNFLAAWLFSAALLPAFLFYENASQINNEIWLKANLFEFAQHRQAKNKLLKQDILKPIEDLKSIDKPYQAAYNKVVNMHLNQGSYYPDSYVLAKKIDSLKENSDTLFSSLLWQLRPIYSAYSRKYQHFNFSKANDGSWLSENQSTKLSFHLMANQAKVPFQVDFIKVDSNRSFLCYLFSKNWVFKSLGFVLLFGVFYWLILFYVDRCYAFRFFYLRPSVVDKNQTEGAPFTDRLKKILFTKPTNSGFFIIGLPSTGKQKFAKQILEGKSYVTLSCSILSECKKEMTVEEIIEKICVGKHRIVMSQPKTQTDPLLNSPENILDYKYYILQNFEHNVLSFEENHKKAKLISYLLANQKKLLITSEIYPSQLIDVYKDQVEQTGELKAEIAQDFNSWRDILGVFPQLLLGITKQHELVNESLEDFKLDENFNPNPINSLKGEFGYSNYLPPLTPIVLSKCSYSQVQKNGENKLMLDQQRMVLHGMHLAHGYYTDIWNSLPRREKYILYDLAKDGFMNIKNSNSLFSLMKKGLIVWEDIPQVFNKSFRNFIMAVGKKDVELSLERRQKGDQNWGTTRVILLIVIVAIITFIIIGNPGFLKDLETFYGALAGVGALIPIMSSLLGKGGRSQ